MNKIKDNNSGFSLLELLVGLAISVVVIFSAYSFVLAGLKSYELNRKTTELQQETQFIENALVDAVENGSMTDSEISSLALAGTGVTWQYVNTGYQIICHDGNGNLLLYDKSEGLGAIGSNIKKHLLSSNVKSFTSKYVVEEYETDPTTNMKKTTLAAGEKSHLIQISFEVELNGKTDKLVKNYKLRND